MNSMTTTETNVFTFHLSPARTRQLSADGQSYKWAIRGASTASPMLLRSAYRRLRRGGASPTVARDALFSIANAVDPYRLAQSD
jgi:hypothetical protein